MDVRQLILKYSFVLNLALLVLIAYFSADGVNAYLADKYLAGAAAAEVTPFDAAPGKRERFAAPADAITRRDLFGSIKVESAVDVSSLEGNTGDLRETDLRLDLVGVYFIGGENPLNIATIKLLKEQEEKLFLVGGQVTEDATVQTIEWNQVILLRSDGRQETLKLNADMDNEPTTIIASAKPGPRGGRKVADTSGLDLDRIEDQGNNQYVIPRDLLEQAMAPENMTNILGQARTIPNRVRDGDQEYIDGFRIFRIRPGSVFDKLGLRNGDVIKSVNGNKLDNFEAAIGMWQGLKDQSSFSISIERQGTPIDMGYQVQ